MDPGPGLPLSLSLFWPLLVLFVCAALLFGWRWLRIRTLGDRKAPLGVVARVELGPQHTLYLVEAADRCLLLGGAPGGLSLLTELPRSLLIPTRPAAAAEPDKELAA
jgi:flagellar biogenesis protein FliO